jgi:hypothetical protein
VLSRLPRLAIVAALACSIGLQWGVLQSIAWVGMMVDYSREGSLGEALVKTFDGRHPCALCKAIAKGQKSDKPAEFPPTVKKFEFLYSPAVFVFNPPTESWEVDMLEEQAHSANRAPPVPPPKAIFG